MDRVYRSMGRASTCERARFWASVAPDDTLSQLERRLLSRHLAQCPECTAFAASVADATEAIRSAPLEPVPGPLGVPSRAGRRARRLTGVGHAWRLSGVTAAAGVAVTLTVLGTEPLRGQAPVSPPNRPAIVIDATTVEGQAEQRQFLHDLRDYRNAQQARESDLAVNRRLGPDAAA
jgi:hypothetical protein